VSCIVNRIRFDDGNLDEQMPQNNKDDAGHRRCILWWLGDKRPSPCKVGFFWRITAPEITRTYTWYAREISEPFSNQNRPIKFNLICNAGHWFMGQEPGTESEIKSFCELNYGVSFPLFSKIDVNGKKTHSLYKELKKRAPGTLGTESIKWNFTKFLVTPNAKTIERFSTPTKPEKIESRIAEMLEKEEK